MSDFMKIRATFSIWKIQKCNAYQNRVEFCHKPDCYDVKWPPPLLFVILLQILCIVCKASYQKTAVQTTMAKIPYLDTYCNAMVMHYVS